MKSCILLMGSDIFWDLMQVSAPNKLEYCMRWKMDLHIVHMETTEPDTYSKQRQIAILNLLDTYDWVWFLGVDTIIMNQTIDARQFMDENYNFVIAHDYNGFNNDSCFYSGKDQTKEFVSKTIKHLDTQPHDWYAQNEARRDMPELKIRNALQKEFNCYLYDTDPAYAGYPRNLEGDYKHGDFILHFPAMCNIHRMELFTEYLPKVIR